VLDSHSVKTTESGGPRGFVAGNKTKGRKRHIVTDTHDRDTAVELIAALRSLYPWLRHLFAARALRPVGQGFRGNRH
jgi:putative transposase